MTDKDLDLFYLWSPPQLLIACTLHDIKNGECEFLMFEQEALETSLIKDPLFRRVEALYVLFIQGKVQGLFSCVAGKEDF